MAATTKTKLTAEHSSWRDFGTQLIADISSAALTAFAISPIVCLIDCAIMRKASTGATLGACISRLVRPVSVIPRMLVFGRPARLVMLVYFGTYSTANSLDTIKKRYEIKHADMLKFGTTAAVSTGLTIYKDSRLVQMLGRGSLKTAVPASSFGLFTLRDAITIFASFNLPALVAPQLSGLIGAEAGRMNAAQFMIPAAIQFITTPIHLLGIDLYNRRGREGLASRIEIVRRDMPSAVPARILRIVPAFSVGGVLNMQLRSRIRRQLSEEAVSSS